MIFEIDQNGIKLTRLSDKMDYHVRVQDILSKNFATVVRQNMAENYKKRIETNRVEKDNQRFKKIFDREIKSTYVTLEDSRRAGNCIAGTLSFARNRLKINEADVISGQWFLKVPAKRLLETKEPRAIAAVNQAWKRETAIYI